MKKLVRFTAILIVLLALTSIASAARSDPGEFTVTGSGYPTHFVPLPKPGWFKVHLINQGSVTGGLTGGFVFDEWMILTKFNPQSVPPSFSGANHGVMTITTAEGGDAKLRFGGVFGETALKASYQFLKGTGDYKSLKGEGTKQGTPGQVFSVIYTPCGGKDSPQCDENRCALFGDDLKIHKDKTQWKISNEGEELRTISRIVAFWPGDGTQLEKVKLGGKTIYDTAAPASMVEIAAGSWLGDAKDRQIEAGKERDLWLEFDGKISAQPWDYTILVEFEGGCAVPFVAFP